VTPSPAPAPALAAPVDAADHAIGPPEAPVTLVVYGDYECPYTLLLMPAVTGLINHFGERLRFVFRHFPLRKHPHAALAAEAAESAAAQGRFWDMHVALFAGQDALEPADLVRYATELGLDVPRFEADLAAHVHRARVERDLESGRRSGVGGTPTEFLNGALYEGEDRLTNLTRAVDALLL
jgi:protein-disulfide isomerase